jgi:hypothetical protein
VRLPAVGSINLASTTGAFSGSRCALVRVTTAAPAESWQAQILLVSISSHTALNLSGNLPTYSTMAGI